MKDIKKYGIAFFLLMLFTVRWEINDYAGNSITQIIENIVRVLAGLVVVWLFLKDVRDNGYLKKIREKDQFPTVFFFLMLMVVCLFISTTVQHGDVKRFIVGYLFPTVIVGLLFESMKEKPDALISGGMLLGEILVYSNLISILLFPDGMYILFDREDLWTSEKNWLLGNRNLFAPCILYACLSANLYRCHGGNKWREWSVYIACLLSVLLVKSGTSSLGLVLLVGLFLLLKTGKIRFNVYFLVAINVLLFFMIVIFRMQNLFSFIIVDILGKDLTLTHRTDLWDALFSLFKERYLLGLGIMEPGGYQDVLGFPFAGQAHNVILDCLLRGGIGYLSCYLAAMAFVYHRLHKFQDTKEAQAIAVTLFVFQIMGLAEAHVGNNRIYVYLIYFIAFNVERFIKDRGDGAKQEAPTPAPCSADGQ